MLWRKPKVLGLSIAPLVSTPTPTQCHMSEQGMLPFHQDSASILRPSSKNWDFFLLPLYLPAYTCTKLWSPSASRRCGPTGSLSLSHSVTEVGLPVDWPARPA